MEAYCMRVLCLLLGTMLLPANEARAQFVDAYYEPLTGGVSFRSDGSTMLAGIRVNSKGHLLLPGYTDLDGRITCALGICYPPIPKSIEWGSLVGFSFDEVFAGNIMPTGLTQQEVRNDLSLLYRTLSEPTLDRIGEVFAVPEPATMVMAIAGMLVCVSARDRASQ